MGFIIIGVLIGKQRIVILNVYIFDNRGQELDTIHLAFDRKVCKKVE